MKFGIENEGLTIKCANCKMLVSKDGELNVNYCSNCGAPLSVSGIADFEAFKEETTKSTLLVLKDIATREKTDSFVAVMREYLKDA